MLATKAPHPNCAYLWMKCVIDAAGAGAAGDRTSARRRSTRRRARSWTRSRPARARSTTLNAPAAYFDTIKFWKTPIADCGNGKNDCMDYNAWQKAWTRSPGSCSMAELARARAAPLRSGPAAGSRPPSGAGPGCRLRAPARAAGGSRSCSSTSARWRALFISAFWQVDPSPARSSTTGRSTTSARSSHDQHLPRGSRCGRSAWPPR